MILALDDLPGFGRATHADSILASCDGRSEHVSCPASVEGIGRTAEGMKRATFPRAEVSRALKEYNETIGAPRAAIDNAERLAREGSLVVTTGQQPCAAFGPLYVLYKAITAVKIAREAERDLGVPVVPVFWNASEDHDIDEIATAAAPGRAGALNTLRVNLEAWRGRPVAAIGEAPDWRPAVDEWLSSLDAAHTDLLDDLRPRRDECWATWFSRGLSRVLGGEGLVLMEPHFLRPLSGDIFERVIRNCDDVQALIRASCEERADAGRACSFRSLDGPPLFVETDGMRRRVHSRDGGFVLRGLDERIALEDLVDLARREPHTFSSHASLRPIVQNALMPVLAAVLGPGEIAYHEELLRFHRSEIGAGRRMPVLWPRASLTILDGPSQSVVKRFGMELRDVIDDEAVLLKRFTPDGALAREIRAVAEAVGQKIEDLASSVLALDGTLERPLAKTIESVSRSLATFGDKVERAEATAQGFAPDRLKRLSAFVRPDGKPQERVFSAAWALSKFGPPIVEELLSSLDIHDGRHKMLTFDEGDDAHDS
jgi:bacillithiol biosynthesis cysteine-adding enzyme BshC